MFKKNHEQSRWHDSQITAVGVHSNLVVSGDLQGKVFCSNYFTGEAAVMLPGCHTQSVESIAFCELLPYCVTCGMDNQLNIFDLSSMSLRSSVRATSPGEGFTRV